MDESRQLVEHFFRHESGRLVAALTRLFGVRHIDLVEDVVQTALLRAMTSWSLKGIPPEPGPWLYRVARNVALDVLRRDLRWNALKPALIRKDCQLDCEPLDEREMNDHLLRMIFICCDESIPPESQVAFALKTLCGFGISEISRALLMTEANVAKRITRAKEKLRSIQLDPDSFSPDDIQDRLPTVQSVIYLLFNEGYCSTQSDHLIREDLCEEAVRLALLLAQHPLTEGPDSSALLALFLFHAARLDGRVDDHGSLLLLEEQDRSKWNTRLIREGFQWFERSARGNRFTRYHAEAWIAAEHCRAKTFQETDWNRIIQAYDHLIRIVPSPIYELNRAIAIAERDGVEAGWKVLKKIDAQQAFENYYLWSATVGELARRRGMYQLAKTNLLQAMELAPSVTEQTFLKKKLEFIEKSIL